MHLHQQWLICQQPSVVVDVANALREDHEPFDMC